MRSVHFTEQNLLQPDARNNRTRSKRDPVYSLATSNSFADPTRFVKWKDTLIQFLDGELGSLVKKKLQQECIPVGCVPLRCSGRPLGEGCLPASGEGVYQGGGGCLPATPPPLWTEWQTRVKNITLPQLRYGR